MLPLMRWGFVVLGSTIPLDDALRRELLTLAIRSYLDDVTRVEFDWQGAAGCLRTDGDAALLGSFIGQRFIAEIDTEERSGKVEFLVTEAQLRWATEHDRAGADVVN
jgi:hypothetical protein